jgi:hypothetical protein
LAKRPAVVSKFNPTADGCFRALGQTQIQVDRRGRLKELQIGISNGLDEYWR